MRNRKGQSALEYAVLITLIAGVVLVLVWTTLKPNVEGTYNSGLGKVTTATGWLDSTMK